MNEIGQKGKEFNAEYAESAENAETEKKESERWILGLAIIRD